jgi:ATP-dependent Zn protease
MKKNSNSKIIIFYIILFAAVILALSFMFGQSNAEEVTYGDVVKYFQNDQVAEFTVDNSNYIEMQVYVVDENGNKTETTQTVGYQLQSLALFVEDCSQYYLNNKSLNDFDIEPETVMPWWVSFLPYVIVIVIF